MAEGAVEEFGEGLKEFGVPEIDDFLRVGRVDACEEPDDLLHDLLGAGGGAGFPPGAADHVIELRLALLPGSAGVKAGQCDCARAEVFHATEVEEVDVAVLAEIGVKDLCQDFMEEEHGTRSVSLGSDFIF